MENKDDSLVVGLFRSAVYCMRRFLFSILSVGPIPRHVAFILDGNRRFTIKKLQLGEGAGHRAGNLSLMYMLKYCHELGVNYVTIYAFSIDNFKRRPEEVQNVMNLILEKIEGLPEEESIVNQYGIKVLFVGNLKLLNQSVRLAAEKAMKATTNNSKSSLLICIAFTSTDEITHAVEGSCQEKWKESQVLNAARSEKEISKDKEGISRVIKLTDIERHMYMAVAPDPDILVRSSGETRLINFLLWQSSNCILYSPKHFGLRLACVVTLGVGCIKLSEGISLFREKKEAIVGLLTPLAIYTLETPLSQGIHF